MTWIKPSFLWMMYRCGWATKAGQETVLAVEITRDGFERALRHACLSIYVRGLHLDRGTWQHQLKRAPARVQWDPERDLHLRPLTYRSLQLGLSGEAVGRYADEWTVAISDVTPLAREIHDLVGRNELDAATVLLPQEHPYPAGDELLAHLRPWPDKPTERPTAVRERNDGLIHVKPCSQTVSSNPRDVLGPGATPLQVQAHHYWAL